MNNDYRDSWSNLKLRRALFFLGLLAPLLFFFFYNALRSGPIPSVLLPLALLGVLDWFVIGAVIAVAAVFFLLNFRCPRCQARFLNLNATNRSCKKCGLSIGASADLTTTGQAASSSPIPSVPNKD